MNQIAEQMKRLYLHDAGQLYAVQSNDGEGYYSQKEKELIDCELQRHIDGELTIAVKPLQQKTQLTKFVCIDFDLETGETLLQLYQLVLKIVAAFLRYGLPVYVEFSGRKGFHLTLFFAEPIPGALARQIVHRICSTVDYKPKEVYPADDYMEDDGKGNGGKNIKLPFGIHRATNKRSGFLPDAVSWDADGFPVVPETQADMMVGFEQVSGETLTKLLRVLEQPISEQKQESKNINVDFSTLSQDQHPACIQRLMERGAPLDQEYNFANLSLCRYGITRGLDDEQAEAIATLMAEHTSPHHSTSKKSVDSKVVNFHSAWMTAKDNPATYQFSCGYLLQSQEIVSSGVCQRQDCPYWSYEHSQRSDTWQATEMDCEVERAILAYVLQNGDAAGMVVQSAVSATGFLGTVEVGQGKVSLPLHQMTWEAIQQLAGVNKEISATTILAEMEHRLKPEYQPEVLAYMHHLQFLDSCQPETFLEYLERVKDTGLRIKAEQRLIEAGKALKNREISLAAIIDDTIDNAKSLQRQTAAEVKPINQYAAELIHNLFGSPVSSMPTQSVWLNHVLNGGWQAGKLYVIGAPPGSGKTTFCTWCADYAAAIGFIVLYVPYEMSREQLWVNSLARIGSIDSSHIEAKRWMETTYSGADNLRNAVENAIRQLHSTVGGNLTIYEAGPEITTAQLKGVIAKTRQQAGLSDEEPLLVVVDYLQLMPSGDSKLDAGMNETARVGKIATALKQLARDTNTAVIAISDITKQAYQEALKSGTLDMSALRDSFKIAHAADVIMLLQTGSITTANVPIDQLQIVVNRISQEGSPQTTNRIASLRQTYPLNPSAKATYSRLSILKNRGGISGEPLFVYEKAYHRFIPMEVQQDDYVAHAAEWEEDGSVLQ